MAEVRKEYKISIRRGREHRVTIDPKKVNSPTEFFYSAYQGAKLQLQEIILASARVKDREERELSTKKRIELLHEYPSNVIAFCADRGHGKTTAMLSFSNALEELGDPQNDSAAAQTFWGTITKNIDPLNVRFEVMAPIDPCSMENSESVLQQIISQLFENFCKRVKENHCYWDFDKKAAAFEAVSDKFQKCAQAIDSLYKAQHDRAKLIEDELDHIAEIGQSGKLLLLFHELFDQYLEVMCGSDGKSCLVVQIDDADMDIGRSYQILEDVRKYLSLPRVVVLMATNIQQLETTVEQHFLQEYEYGLKHPGSMITVGRCHSIAVLYLEKAIPHTRRIYLPDIDETIRLHLSHLTVDYQDEDGKPLIPQGTYQKQLLDLLYRKTGMVFTFERDYLHNLLPSHMRELSQFLPFFTSLEDLGKDCLCDGYASGNHIANGYEIAAETFIQQHEPREQKNNPLPFLDQWENNLGRLEFYLVNLWSAVNLRENSRRLFREFVAQPANIRNLFLLLNITDYYVGERAALEIAQPTLVWNEADCRNEFIKACEQRGIDLPSYSGDIENEQKEQSEISASYADVMGVLDILTDLPGANRQYKFAYAIRLFYSIRMHIMLIQEIRALERGFPSKDTEKGIREIDFRTLTGFLQDTLLKYGPVNDTDRTPFGCWILEMPVQWFQPFPIPQPFDPEKAREVPFLRWKYKGLYETRAVSIIGSKGAPGVWRSIADFEAQREVDIVVFSPLYPLLEALDRFIRFQHTSSMVDDETKYRYMSQIYISLLVCLNWDVQRVLFKMVKNQAGNTVEKMAGNLYSLYIPKLPALVPGEMPAWLQLDCFKSVVEDAHHSSIFDVLTMRVHPAPEFREYLRKIDDGLTRIEKELSALGQPVNRIATTLMKTLWKNKTITSNDEKKAALNNMDEIVWATLFPSRVVGRYIAEEMSKRKEKGDLFRLLTDFLSVSSDEDTTSKFTLKESNLSPHRIKGALASYRERLEELIRSDANSADEKSTEASWEISETSTLDEDPSASVLGPAGEREAVVRTLQNLIQFGQQLLKVLESPQQKESVKDISAPLDE